MWLASGLKTDYIPYGRRFSARSAAGGFNPEKSNEKPLLPVHKTASRYSPLYPDNLK
jgi:hypothetical protein